MFLIFRQNYMKNPSQKSLHFQNIIKSSGKQLNLKNTYINTESFSLYYIIIKKFLPL